MEIDIICFGKIAEMIKAQRIDIADIGTTDELKARLEEQFPALSAIKYKLALNKQIVQQNVNLQPNDTVAIMPPFSGG